MAVGGGVLPEGDGPREVAVVSLLSGIRSLPLQTGVRRSGPPALTRRVA